MPGGRPKKEATLTPAERTARWREGFVAAGGWRASPIHFDATETDQVRALMARRNLGFSDLVKALVREASTPNP